MAGIEQDVESPPIDDVIGEDTPEGLAFMNEFNKALKPRRLRRLSVFDIAERMLINLRHLGGTGSGNYGHEGRPGKVGGSSDSGGNSVEAQAEFKDPGGFGHTGIIWKQKTDANGRPIPIKVRSVEEGVLLILDGKVVEVKDVATANTLIERLAEVAAERASQGREAKDYDLCQVSVAGSNLFCAESLRSKEYPDGVPRLEMPQLGGKPMPGSEADKLPRNPWDPSEVDGSKQFVTYLQGIGVTTSSEVLQAASLKASQRELIGSKVAKMITDKKSILHRT